MGKWSGEMPGAEVSPGRPRDSRWPGRGEDGRLARAGGSRPPSESPPRPPSPGHSTLLGPALPRLGFPPPAEFRSSPGRLARRSPHRRQPRPRARGSHLGAGAGPAHRPEQQQRQAERPRDAGHGGALSTGPSLPPAARRAPRSPGRAGGRGGGAGAGPPRPQEGPGGSWLSNPGRRGSPGRSFSCREVPGTALRVGALGFGARRSRAVLIPHPDHLPNPSAKESQTAPKLSRVPQRELGPEKRTGLGQGHTFRQTLSGKCNPKSCEWLGRQIHPEGVTPSPSPLLLLEFCPEGGSGTTKVEGTMTNGSTEPCRWGRSRGSPPASRCIALL